MGIDINVLKNRLNFTYDFYYDKNKEMLTDMSSAVGVPISVGGGYAEENYGQINAWGSEFSLNWSDKIKSNISYNIGINFSYNNNEVKRFPDQGNLLPSNNTTREGRSVGYLPFGLSSAYISFQKLSRDHIL